MGAYPDSTLKRARELRDEARKVEGNGVVPSADPQSQRSALSVGFESVAAKRLALHAKSLAPGAISMLISGLGGRRGSIEEFCVGAGSDTAGTTTASHRWLQRPSRHGTRARVRTANNKAQAVAATIAPSGKSRNARGGKETAEDCHDACVLPLETGSQVPLAERGGQDPALTRSHRRWSS